MKRKKAAERPASPAATNRRIEASLAHEGNAIRGRVHAVTLRRLEQRQHSHDCIFIESLNFRMMATQKHLNV